MSFLWKAIGLGSSSIPNFNFTLGDVISTATSPTLTWTLRAGVRNDDQQRVTIFELNLASADVAVKEMARNVAKRAKTLMLPGFLRCFDSTEYNNVVYVSTEECVPLKFVLASDDERQSYYEDTAKFEEGVALGLRHVGMALSALHANQLLHGNVSHDSVFVTRSGEWRLFGLDLVSPPAEEHSVYRRYWGLLPDYRRPPETTAAGGVSSAPLSAAAIDSWGLGCLIFAAFAGAPQIARLDDGTTKATDLRGARTMPRTLQQGFVGLTSSNPKLRLTVDKFLADTEFIAGSEYVRSLLALDELALKDAADRDALYRRLTGAIDGFPIRTCKFVILAKLSVAVQYGGGSATALEPILKIGARLDPPSFAELVAPIVMTLFASTDNLVRLRLLGTAQQYARLLPASLVCDKIWPHYSASFSSTNANMRELAVRALVYFAPHLNERILTTDVPRFIAQLQQDREGPIRTNSTVCLCLVAQYLPESARSKLLVNGFGRMLKDPFPPSRMAALKSTHTTMPFISVPHIVELLMPAVAPLATDPQPDIREAALRALDAMMARLREFHASAPPPPTTAAAAAPQAADAKAEAESAAAGVTPLRSLFGSWGGSSTGAAAPTQPAPSSGAASPAGSATAAASAAPVAAPAAAASAGGSWGDLDDDFGEPVATPSAAAQQPVVVVAAPAASAGAAAGGTGLKLKKKGFGGGAAKVE